MAGGLPKPSTRMPSESLVDGLNGPRMTVMPCLRSQSAAVCSSSAATSASSTHSKKPKKPADSPWYSL